VRVVITFKITIYVVRFVITLVSVISQAYVSNLLSMYVESTFCENLHVETNLVRVEITLVRVEPTLCV
jgi:hypothetical protein